MQHIVGHNSVGHYEEQLLRLKLLTSELASRLFDALFIGKNRNTATTARIGKNFAEALTTPSARTLNSFVGTNE
jgi:hypothetical protein